MTDLDLQKLIDAKKDADRKAADAAEKRRIDNIKANDASVQATVDWKSLDMIANEEAGRIASVSSQTGIQISGIQGKALPPESIAYRLTRDRTALEIDIIFTRLGNAAQVQVVPTKPAPPINQIRYVKQYPSAKAVNVREVLGDVVTKLIHA